jgi:NAD(P)-dependent dehydrogenase (short-subunit alcohol dehydrogenase family)
MAKEMGKNRPAALVTGGGTGVGAATALMLAQRGYDVAEPIAAAGRVRRVNNAGRPRSCR